MKNLTKKFEIKLKHLKNQSSPIENNPKVSVNHG
jgi:hypothetical protein